MAQIQSIYAPKTEEQLKKVYAELERHQNKLLELSKISISFYGKQTASNPDQLKKAIKTIDQLNAKIKEQDAALKKLQSTQAKVNTTQAKIERQNQKQLATNEKNYRVNQKLSSSWNQLNQRLQKAELKYKNLAASNRASSKEIERARLLTLKYRAEVDKINTSVKRFNGNVGNYKSALGKARFAFTNFASAFGVFSAGFIALDIFNTIKEIDGLDKALKQVTETTESYNQAQGFLKDLSDEAGVEINSLQKAYTKFYAASKTTNLSLKQTQNIFRQTAKAGSVLGLSTDNINGAFTALEQILSKGKVQAEEIRGQLGERLPGAFQILAKSMGLTTQELSKQLELGNVISEEVLPNFAKELEKTFGLDAVKKVETLTASQNRLSNAWNEFVRSLDGSEGTLTRIFTKIIDGLTSILKGLEAINKSANQFNNELESNALESQIENYKELGKEANAYALIRKKSAEELIIQYEKEIKGQEEILENFKQYNAFQKLIRPEARNAQKRIERLNNSIATQKGILKAAKVQLGELTLEVDSNTESVKGNTKAIDENNKTREKGLKPINNHLKLIRTETSETWVLKQALEEKIKLLKEVQNLYPKNSKEAKQYSDEINKLNIALGETSAIDVSGAMAEIQASIDNAPSLDPPDDMESNWKNTFTNIANIASQAIGIIDELNQRAFDAQNERLESQYQNALALAGDNVAAQEEVERQYTERKNKLAQEQAEKEKQSAIFSAIIDTASSILKTGAELGYPAALPFQVYAGILGAAKIGLIASTPTPAYWQGGTVDGSQDILVNDDPFGKKGSNYKEVIEQPNGKILTPQGRNVKMKVPKGSYVHPTYDAFLSSLDMELMNNSISPSSGSIMPMIINSGLTRDEINEVMNAHANRLISTINGKNGVNINIDENGLNKYITKKGRRSKILNARFTGKGSTV